MKRFLKASIIPLGVTAFVVLMWAILKDTTIDVLMPTGQIADEQRKLFVFTIILSLVVIIPVFVMLTVFAVRYREDNKKADYKPEWGSSAKLETLWWGIPILIIGVLSVVTWQTSHSLDPYKPIASDKKTLEIQVVALQWKWLFIYPEYKLATINELPLPANRPVHFSLAADAPMSGFWIPSLGSQIYSMNGMDSQLNLIANKTGSYKGYNTNINGEGYAKMTFDAKVMPEVDFTSWTLTAPEKAAQAGNQMNEATYDTLAKPGLMPQPRTYHLVKTDLYDTIMMKYMGHGHASDGSADTTHDMNTMDHDTMNHGGHAH